MMTLHKLGAGHGYTYLTRQVAANDVTDTGAPSLGAYYSERGESPGVWLGRGLAGLNDGPRPGDTVSEAQMIALFGQGRHPNADAVERAALAAGASPKRAKAAGAMGVRFSVHDADPVFRDAVAARVARRLAEFDLPFPGRLPERVRAGLRTDVGRELFTAQHGRAPRDGRELTDFITAATRPGYSSVAGYDLTFSPVKSVSTLWALSSPETAAAIQDAHQAAVADVMSWLESTAAYTRLGRDGVRQVDVTGLIAVAFTHRDSRAGDPDLHTHVAISNKVQTLDGKWRALDGRVLHKAAVAASERYNTRLEAQLTARLGVRFADRPDTPRGRQPVREIVGVDPRLAEHWSSRRADITARQQRLAARFTNRHGRQPTPDEERRLFQQANTDTRQRKHEPRFEADQRRTWHADAVTVLGDEEQVRAMFTHLAQPAHLPAAERRGVEVTPDWIQASARAALIAVSDTRATWQAHHLRAEAERLARAAEIGLGDVDTTVEAILTRALSPDVAIPLGVPDPIAEPAALRRLDGTSQFSVAGSQLYTSHAVFNAERRIVAAAALRDGRVLDSAVLDATLANADYFETGLTPGQRDLIRALATSGARVQVAIAPAGAGKTTALETLQHAWIDGHGDVIGLAPSAAAAAQLREALETSRTDTIAKFLHAAATDPQPQWITRIGPRTLIIIDEAGMASTRDLDAVISLALKRGASVRLVGDTRQLASPQSGGILRELATLDSTVTLDTVVRFADPHEAHASTQLRVGDLAALNYYLAQDRIQAADHATVITDAHSAWEKDRAAGLDSVLLAPTNDLVRELNQHARTERLAAAGGQHGPEARLHDHTVASAGDTIVTRRNNRALPITPTDWVKNGDRWHLDTVTDTGDLHVTHLHTRRHLTLPADYAARHVELGYATTIHLAQGQTTDTAHTVLGPGATREALYVAMTRGRTGNHLYLDTSTPTADSHAGDLSGFDPTGSAAPTSLEMLHTILTNESAQISAIEHQRLAADPAVALRTAITRYTDAVTAAPTDSTPGSAGYGAGPLPWLPPIPVTDDTWSDYLTARADQIRDLTALITAEHAALPDAKWVRSITEQDPNLARDVAVWRVANDIPTTDRRPTGPRNEHAASYQKALDQRIKAIAGTDASPSETWRAFADSLDPRITQDRAWPELARLFDTAAKTGWDVETNVRHILNEQTMSADQLESRIFYECPAALPPVHYTPPPARQTHWYEIQPQPQYHQKPSIDRGGPSR